MSHLFESNQKSLIDFAKDALSILNTKFVVGGGLARAFHGTTRLTKDLDIIILTSDLPSVSNLLLNHGFKQSDHLQYSRPDREIVKFEKDGYELDIMFIKNPSIEKFIFETAESKEVFGKHVNVLGIDGFLLTKLISWRNKDKADIEDVIESKKKFDLLKLKEITMQLKIFDRMSIFETTI
jgi:hypothetical protein